MPGVARDAFLVQYTNALLSPSGSVESTYVIPVGTSELLSMLFNLFMIPNAPKEEMSLIGEATIEGWSKKWLSFNVINSAVLFLTYAVPPTPSGDFIAVVLILVCNNVPFN